MPSPFVLHSDYSPAGDQPQAIAGLTAGIESGQRYQTLLGVTGSGKTFTIANVIARLQRPALVISHNKTLAAQLYNELKAFFPENAVEYFVSFYDYYQPEAYIPQTDTYIAKDAAINDQLEQLRLAATGALLERRDTIVVASVSCLYGLGSPEDFAAMQARINLDQDLKRDELLRRLVEIQYTRNDFSPARGQFRVAGDTLEVFPSHRDDLLRVEFWGDTVERLSRHDPISKKKTEELQQAALFPAKHFVLPQERIRQAEAGIREELAEQVAWFESQHLLVEAQRIHQRTNYDLDMLREIGYCQGIENYSRHLAGRPAGSRPYTLMDYFPADYLTIIDESHATLPQIHAMPTADRNRKQVLVDNGFRLPSALDNRPVTFEEFESMQKTVIFVSATPGKYELSLTQPVEQVVRPTGLLDPQVEVRPLATQVDDAIHEIKAAAARGERTLVTTLTKKMAEDLSDYLRRTGIRSNYLHSELDTFERVEILHSLRSGEFDCLVGINLLREGLDLPEVAQVLVLDADKEGFLRSETSLLQTAGRAARNRDGRVILYADRLTDSIKSLQAITSRRRAKQLQYNAEHGITPQTIKRREQDSLRAYKEATERVAMVVKDDPSGDYDILETIRQMEQEMLEAAEALEFERAAMLRDQIFSLKKNPGRKIAPARKTAAPKPAISPDSPFFL
ncbi:MAG: excinuclease ABC subunit UvrB [Lentisphaerae bacterium]|nr:excinuclease ABC subunit UvrB [Lentisphaerota bacterium]